MIDKPTKIGNKTLYNVRVLNMSVAKHYGLVKEYCEIVSKAREELKTKSTDDNSESDIFDMGEKSFEEDKKIYNELTLYFSVKKHLDQLVLQKLMKNKIQKFGASKR
jgi:hypothetical protein